MTNTRAALTCVAAAASIAILASACTSSGSDGTPTSPATGGSASQGSSGPSGSSAPSGSTSTGTAPKAVPGAVNGLVVDKGAAVAHARIKVVLSPNTRTIGALKRGKKVPAKLAAVAVTTQPKGAYTARLDRKLVSAKYRDGAVINVEIFVLSPKGNASYAVPMTLAKGKLQGVSAVFDLGAKTIAVNGTSSALQVF